MREPYKIKSRVDTSVSAILDRVREMPEDEDTSPAMDRVSCAIKAADLLNKLELYAADNMIRINHLLKISRMLVFFTAQAITETELKTNIESFLGDTWEDKVIPF